jgi:hypothetical protein
MLFKNVILLFFCFLAGTQVSLSQTRYLVRFKDKVGTQFSITDPSAYLSSRSIARRTRYNIAIDSTDLPVSAAYIQSLRNIPNVTILNISKWLNQVSIQTSDPAAITAINSLPFVRASMPIAARLQEVAKDPAYKFESTFPSTKAKFQGALQSDHFNYGQSDAQVRIHNGAFLHNIGLRGQNMIISMLDAGFFLYTSLKAFDSVNKNGQVLGTYDFVNRELSVVEDNAHGMNCFSIIAANIPGEFVGTAPKANFYLYRSEEAATEYPIEEHNWVCAAERTDSVGGDVISSSLGYTTFDNPVYNHTYAEMNGNTTMAAIGADLAAKKGILVFNSAGNDGDKPWKFISTPADADSIVAVGAINVNGVIAAFSSFGPSSDGQVKPDVVSVGVSTVLQGTNNTISRGNGTSFSCPNIAGLATCLWQGFQEFNNMKIIQALRQSSNNFNTPNDRLGYGIPDMKKATMLLIKDFATSNAQLEGCKPVINWTSKDAKGMKYEIERRGPGETSFTKIGEQISTTTLFANQTYRFTDPSTFSQSGPAIYRIRQFIDTTSGNITAEYIDTTNAISITGGCTVNQFFITPNLIRASTPVQIQLTYPEAMPQLELHITNMTGQVLYRMNSNKPAGVVTIQLPHMYLAAGKYHVAVYNGKKLLGLQEFIKLP